MNQGRATAAPRTWQEISGNDKRWRQCVRVVCFVYLKPVAFFKWAKMFVHNCTTTTHAQMHTAEIIFVTFVRMDWYSLKKREKNWNKKKKNRGGLWGYNVYKQSVTFCGFGVAWRRCFEGLKNLRIYIYHYTRRQGLYIGAPLVNRVRLVVVVMCVNTGWELKGALESTGTM